MKITVFTPTFNRAHLLRRLYESLCRQSYTDFEWIVVDDGSTDSTPALLDELAREHKIDLRSERQPNGGKHRAINRGVRLAHGELFFIVDSDDFLADNALERVAFHYAAVRGNDEFAGVSGVRVFPNGARIGGEVAWGILDCSALDFRFLHKVRGDMAEVFRTEILRAFPFPEIEGETFCSESLVWNRIARSRKMRWFNEKIYIGEYLPDGLTASSVRRRRASPEAALLNYAELMRASVPAAVRFRAGVNFWRFAFASKRGFFSKLRQAGACSLLGFFPGMLMFFRDSFSKKR